MHTPRRIPQTPPETGGFRSWIAGVGAGTGAGAGAGACPLPLLCSPALSVPCQPSQASTSRPQCTVRRSPALPPLLRLWWLRVPGRAWGPIRRSSFPFLSTARRPPTGDSQAALASLPLPLRGSPPCLSPARTPPVVRLVRPVLILPVLAFPYSASYFSYSLYSSLAASSIDILRIHLYRQPPRSRSFHSVVKDRLDLLRSSRLGTTRTHRRQRPSPGFWVDPRVLASNNAPDSIHLRFSHLDGPNNPSLPPHRSSSAVQLPVHRGPSASLFPPRKAPRENLPTDRLRLMRWSS